MEIKSYSNSMKLLDFRLKLMKKTTAAAYTVVAVVFWGRNKITYHQAYRKKQHSYLISRP